MRYLERIGAVCEGAGSYYVSNGYERAWVKITEDGSVEADPSLPKPTKAEAAEIKSNAEKLLNIVVPITPVPMSAGLPKVEGDLFVYKDSQNRVLLVVQRVEIDGYDLRGKPKKDYLPWIYNGSSWVQQGWPPELPCPLYGTHHGRTRIMVHEGEKACQAAIEAARPESGHPWQEDLALFGHCTWRAGTKAVHRADWNEIPRGAEVWIMPDNDSDGYDAAHKIPEFLSHAKSVYLFHYRNFPGVKRSWDMADEPFLEKWEQVEAGFRLAEKAYETWYDPEADKFVHTLRKDFAQKFAYSMGTGEFIELARPIAFLKPDQLNNAYLHLCPPGWNLAKKMLACPHLTIVDKFGYRPATFDENGVFRHFAHFTDDQGSHCANMYRPLTAKEDPPISWGEYRPLLAYLRYLLPKPVERKILIRWICCVVSGRRLPWAVLMISKTQGTGKSTLARMVRALVGNSNSSQVTPATLHDKFTSWALNKQLIVVPELKEGSAFQLAEHLKTFIEDPTIPIRRMNVDQYDAENHLSIFASSNHMTAISIKRGDRRWFLPEVTEGLPPHRSENGPLADYLRRYLTLPGNDLDGAFFVSIQNWFYNRGGREKCLWAARHYGKFLLDSGWHSKNSRSPETERRTSVEGMSSYPWEESLEELIQDADVVVCEDLRWALEEMKLKFVPKAAIIGDKLSDMGFLPALANPDSTHPPTKAGYTILVSRVEDGKQKHLRGTAMARVQWMKKRAGVGSDDPKRLTPATIRGEISVFSPLFKAWFGSDPF